MAAAGRLAYLGPLRESLSDDRELDECDEDSGLLTDGGAECGAECECTASECGTAAGATGAGVYALGATGAGPDGAVRIRAVADGVGEREGGMILDGGGSEFRTPEGFTGAGWVKVGTDSLLAIAGGVFTSGGLAAEGCVLSIHHGTERAPAEFPGFNDGPVGLMITALGAAVPPPPTLALAESCGFAIGLSE